jgi:REP-associated tyrosine transposase
MSPPSRLKERDYSHPGFYFVTICANYKRSIFGGVIRRNVDLTPAGRIVHESWIAIPSHFVRVNLHSFVVMPNHFHGILQIAEIRLAQHAVPLQGNQHGASARPGSLSVIVRSFKAEVTRRARLELNWKGEIWQRNYFDRVIRDGRELADVSRYIEENPMKWEWDQENPQVKTTSEGEGLAQHAVPLQRSDRTEK